MLNMFRNTIYIQLRAQKMTLLHVESNVEINMVPEIAIQTLANGSKAVIAVGHEVREAKNSLQNIEIANGFLHPRSLLADFTVAEQTLKMAIKNLMPVSMFATSPTIIFHPLEKNEGGFTQVEMRAFEELCKQVGAKKVIIHQGAVLTNDFLLKISATGKYEQ